MFYSTVIPDLIGNPDSSATDRLDSRLRGNDTADNKYVQNPCQNGQASPNALPACNAMRPPAALRAAFRAGSIAGRHCGGQALVESCIVIALICLILSGFFQLSLLYAAKEISAHACFRGARAKTVGFNDFMVKKSVLVGTIPNAGRMTFPETSGGPLGQMAIERGRIPLYLGAEWHMLDGILQYEDWDTINCSYPDDLGLTFQFSVSQDMPLRFFPALFGAFYDGSTIPVGTELEMENHASLYLE